MEMRESGQMVSVTLKKIHMILVVASLLVSAFIIPLLTISGSYYQAKADIQKQIADIQLQNTQTFATKQDVSDMARKLDSISNDLSEVKGYLFKRK